MSYMFAHAALMAGFTPMPSTKTDVEWESGSGTQHNFLLGSMYITLPFRRNAGGTIV